MTSAGFPLPNSNWYFSMIKVDHTFTITITNNNEEVVKVDGSTKRIALERAWDALQEYCFGRKKVM